MLNNLKKKVYIFKCVVLKSELIAWLSSGQVKWDGGSITFTFMAMLSITTPRVFKF